MSDHTSKVPERISHTRIIDATTIRNFLDTKTYDILNGTTPNVANLEYFLSHLSSVTVTNFKNGQEGQHLYILGNGNTTVTHGTNIFTSTSANKLLLANRMYHFIFHSAKWYEV